MAGSNSMMRLRFSATVSFRSLMLFFTKSEIGLPTMVKRTLTMNYLGNLCMSRISGR
jgi:hypothetical protein